jgi:hypothetical protein
LKTKLNFGRLTLNGEDTILDKLIVFDLIQREEFDPNYPCLFEAEHIAWDIYANANYLMGERGLIPYLVGVLERHYADRILAEHCCGDGTTPLEQITAFNRSNKHDRK